MNTCFVLNLAMLYNLLNAVQTSFVPDKEQYNMTKSQLLAQMDVSMGGRVAEELVFGPDKVTTGADNVIITL